VHDSRVLDRLAAGDEQALAELYDGYGSTAYSLAQRFCGDEHLAEAVVVDVFRTLWQAPTDLPPRQGAFSTWLLSAVHRQAVDTVRRAGIDRPGTEALLAEITAGPSADSPAPTPAAIGPVVGDAVRGAIAELPAELAQMIILGYYGGYTQRQVAALLGLPLATVRRRMFAAVHHLRGAMGPIAGDTRLAGHNPNGHAASSGPGL
jgi:RNA polymerase sigma factor (sigma-70 family)